MSLLLLMSSCATIINGRKEKVSINSNIENGEVYVNGQRKAQLEGGVAEFKLKRSTPVHNVSVQASGYGEANYKFLRTANLLPLSNLPSGLIFLPFVGDLTGDSIERSLVFLTASLAAPIVGLAVDFTTGSSYSLHKTNHTFYLYPKMPMGNSDEQLPMLVQTISSSVIAGNIIGSHTNKDGEEIRQYKWTSQLGSLMPTAFQNSQEKGFNTKIMALTLNSDLNDLGYNIAEKPQIIIEPTLKKTSFNTQSAKGGYMDVDVSVRVLWEIKTSRDVVLDTITTSARSSIYDEAMKHALAIAFNDSAFYSCLLPKKKTVLNSDIENTGAKIQIETKDLKEYPNFSDLSEDVSKAVVTVSTAYGHGSGFLISEDGYLLTNEHVIEGSDVADIILNNGFKLQAKVIKYIPESDLALLKVDMTGLPFLSLNYSSLPRIGEDVMAIGTPLDEQLSQSVSKGIVSGIRQKEDVNLIQTDVGVNSGNSGGPLVNQKGEVIGIISFKMTGDGVENIGFAISILDAIQKLNIEIVEGN